MAMVTISLSSSFGCIARRINNSSTIRSRNNRLGFVAEQRINNSSTIIRAIKEETKKQKNDAADEVTQKYGLEAALFKIFSSKEPSKSKGDQAKDLLTKYGGAYLATSITLSLVSFTLCYALITAGVDVPALLQKVGISANQTGEKLGTFALAYAAHKAASPIRFPPTVALTPIVATWIGKKVDKDN